MSTKAASYIFILLLVSSIFQEAFATNVRGRVELVKYSSRIPYYNAKVEFCSRGSCYEDVTGVDGMYYIEIPQGNYSLFVNGTLKHTISIPQTSSFDIPPVSVQDN